MNYQPSRSQFSDAWSFATQAATTDDEDQFVYTIEHDGSYSPDLQGELSDNSFDNRYSPLEDNYGLLGRNTIHYPPVSPTGSEFMTTTSVPDDCMVYPALPNTNQADLFVALGTVRHRPNSFPSSSSSRAPYLNILDMDRPTRHDTFERDTGEEELFNNVIHRLSDEERRHIPATHRPTFICLYKNCNSYIMHRTQVKPHLVDHHGIRFPKPFGCSCGAEFGRAVEAARHVEDKKACESCGRAGRKSKGSSICLRCLRPPPGR